MAGAAIDPRLPLGTRVAAFLRAGLHYAFWYPGRWLGWGRWPRYRSFARVQPLPRVPTD